ncbi:uncharacterized protein MELLADRAFT_93814 [Melampsora larici-populina 98AG31]|uniref:Uncharacterized protein n=1 Tax=Melampsora larici-populina (strain 98AG31 / pathotype 3-4-7) TaxID=747676 RepID=F4S5C6_MELLP|nr:uncharacterized protein MELLADRAFT_93814 [Melampsora larici-populina 98AG31]EGG00143.1 hypothetical protein MELLADRAFT_93814 [Melampsora larici-populina 98AG31]
MENFLTWKFRVDQIAPVARSRGCKHAREVIGPDDQSAHSFLFHLFRLFVQSESKLCLNLTILILKPLHNTRSFRQSPLSQIMSSQTGRIDNITAQIASQSNRTQPYSLTTPRGNRTLLVGPSGSANRAEQRSIRGTGSQTSVRGGNDGNNDGDVAHIMAAITSLSGKVEKEMLVMSETLRQEIEHMSSKIDEDIGQLASQVDKQIASVANKHTEDFITLSNKLDQVNESVDVISTHGGGPPGSAPGAAAAANAPAVGTGPWSYSPELKSRVYTEAYASVPLPTIGAYTKLHNPNGDVLPNSLFATIKRAIKAIPGSWASEQLPPVVNGAQNVADTQTYATLVKDAGKHARERLHKLVLLNIKNNPGSTVPCMKRLVHRIAQDCGTTADGLDEEAYWIKCTVQHRLRIAYLRREALRIFQERRRGGAGGNIWARVDQHLHHLAVQGALYSSA